MAVAESDAHKKPSKLPMIVWGATTVGLLFRTFFRPARAVVQKGYATQCPGKAGGSCSPSMVVTGTPGAVPVYALTSGMAAITSDGILSIASDREPIVVSYGPGAAQIFVQTGQHVMLGQEVAVMGQVHLSITELVRENDGSITFRPIDPASYLAARGLKIAQSGNTPSGLWCTHGRNITVPTETLGCGVKLPAPSALMLLPVTVTTE